MDWVRSLAETGRDAPSQWRVGYDFSMFDASRVHLTRLLSFGIGAFGVWACWPAWRRWTL